jgi:hypothetical protein
VNWLRRLYCLWVGLHNWDFIRVGYVVTTNTFYYRMFCLTCRYEYPKMGSLKELMVWGKIVP